MRVSGCEPLVPIVLALVMSVVLIGTGFVLGRIGTISVRVLPATVGPKEPAP